MQIICIRIVPWSYKCLKRITIIIIIIIIITPSEFFISVLVAGLSVKFEWEKVSSSV